MNECPHCHFKITREGARFCPWCGRALLPEETAEAKQPAEEKETKGPAKTVETFGYCPHCQAPLTRPGQKFCGRCGQKILPEKEAEIPGRSQKVEPFPKPTLPVHPAVLQKRRASGVIPALLVIILLAGGGFAWGFFQGYFLDTKPPQVMITSPAGDKEVVLLPGKSAQESIAIAAGDNRRLKKVELFLNGALVKQFEKGEPFVYRWSTKEEGEYTFKAFAYDNCGNKSNSVPVVITAAKAEGVNEKQVSSFYDKKFYDEKMEEQEIEIVIAKWVRTAEEKDLYGHLDCYAEHMDQYFKKYNIPKSEVLRSKEEIMKKYVTIDMKISNLQVDLVNKNKATATFIKEWDAKGEETFSGEEMQRLELQKFNNEWKITREEEVEIYWVIRNGKRII